MSKPVQFLVENRKTILQVYDNSKASQKKTWDALQKILPELCQIMTFNTFKQYLSILIALITKLQEHNKDELSNIRHKCTEQTEEIFVLKQTLSKKNAEIKQDKSKLSKLSQKNHQMTIELNNQQSKMEELKDQLSKHNKRSQNIEGWTVRLTSKGYYHLCKSIGGKVESIYIGKVLDKEKARKRIAERLSKLR